MEIVLAAIAGYLFAQLMMWQHKRTLAYGERIMEQDRVEQTRSMKESWDSLFGSGPIHLRVEGETIRLDYVSTSCPGPHVVEIAANAIEARQYLARYLADRIAEARFSRISIEQ
jgi:hypothetical protein